MATNKTDYLKMDVWEPTDYVQRTEFNGNFAKIDADAKKKADEIAVLNKTNLYFQGVAFDTTNENKHVSWTHDNISYDTSDKSFYVVYNAQNSHSITSNKVYARKKPKNGNFSNAILIADKLAQGISCKCQSSGICKNGDYIAIVAHINSANASVLGTFVYRSLDKGLTWDSGTELLVGGQSLVAYSGDVSGFKRLDTGRIILWGWYPNKKSFALYSNDDGFTWIQGLVPNINNVTEPTFIELDNGVVVGYARDNVSDGTDGKKSAWFLKSLDGGETWQQPIKSVSIVDMTNNNCCFIKHDKVIEIIYGSRFLQSDGFGSVYQSITTQSDLENDAWSKQIRIGRGYGIPTNYSGDFGYFGSATDEDGTSLIFYYNGTKQNSSLYYLEGNFNYNNGSKLLSSSESIDSFGVSTEEFGIGDFGLKKGRFKVKRSVGGKNLFADLTVASSGEAWLSIVEKVGTAETNLGTLKLTQDGQVASNTFRAGSKTIDGVKGSYLTQRKEGGVPRQLEQTIDSALKGRLIYGDGTVSLTDLSIDTNVIYPSIDKDISLGTDAKRFKNGYFTGIITCMNEITANRPITGLIVGAMMYDRTLGKPIWVKQVSPPVWVDATGATV